MYWLHIIVRAPFVPRGRVSPLVNGKDRSRTEAQGSKDVPYLNLVRSICRNSQDLNPSRMGAPLPTRKQAETFSYGMSRITDMGEDVVVWPPVKLTGGPNSRSCVIPDH